MMKLYLIFTKKGLAVILALTVLVLILLGQFSTVSHSFADGSTHQNRMEFLSLLDIRVNETPISVKESRIPDELTGAAAEYNSLQQKAGFDLSNFRGKAVTVYTYALTEFPEKRVSIIVAEGKIIAGDITDTLNGVTTPLTKDLQVF